MGQTDNWNPWGSGQVTTYNRVQTTGIATAVLTGIVAPPSSTVGTMIELINFGPGTIRLVHDKSSAAGNRFVSACQPTLFDFMENPPDKAAE